MIKRYITVLLCSIISIWNLSGQDQSQGIIRSIVVDTDGENISFATVTLHKAIDQSLVKASYTDDNGKFELPGISPGRFFIKITFIGYQSYTSEEFEFDGNNLDHPTCIMLPQAQELEEIIVKGKKPIIEIKPDKTVFNIEGSVNAQGDDALGLLKKSPGVIVDNNDNIQLQGRSGVRIYIDNKPSPLSANDLATFLRGLQSSDIASIEIITNPSSKYEAEGNAGIINIILKKNKNLGLNASLSTGAAISQNQSYNGSINLNYRNKKTNLFGNYSYADNNSESFIDLERRISNVFFTQSATILDYNKNNNFKIGLDYYLNDNSTFGVQANGFIQDGGNINNSINNITNDITKSTSIDAVLIASNEINNRSDNFNYNINYQLKRKSGQTFNIDLDYGTFNKDSESFQPNNYFEADRITPISSNISGNKTNTDIKIYTAKSDYEQNIGKGVLGVGTKYSLVKTDNDFIFTDYIDNLPIADASKSNRFKYDEQVSAAYVNYQYTKQKWSFQAGIRGEWTISKGKLISTSLNTKNDREYFDIFPSGGVTYSANDKNTWRVSYSRRLDRPNYQDLNPFEFKLDELAFMKGNPNLNPQYTNNVQLSHTYNYSLNTTISYSRTTDLMTRLTDTSGVNTSFLIWENLAEQNNYSINVSYPFSPAEWWSVYANATGYRVVNKSKQDEGRFTEGKSVNLSANVFTFFAQNTIQLPKDFMLELSGFYNSPGIWGGNFKTDNYWNIDIGVQKKLFSDRATIKVGVSDVLEGQRWQGSNNFGVLSIDAKGGNESRRLKINFTYLFGNNKIKAARKRKTGIEDEKKRSQ